MRNGLYIAAAAVLLMAVPAAAGDLRVQSTEVSSQAGVYISPGGVGVRVGEPDVRRDRDRDRRRGWRDRDVRGDRDGRRGCKTVTVRERSPSGAMITRTRSSC